jgi:hypothetical protein
VSKKEALSFLKKRNKKLFSVELRFDFVGADALKTRGFGAS